MYVSNWDPFRAWCHRSNLQPLLPQPPTTTVLLYLEVWGRHAHTIHRHTITHRVFLSTARSVALLQTPNSALGVALLFHNYVLKPKDMRGCEHGWWKVNEIMYVAFERTCICLALTSCDGFALGGSPSTVSVAATWDTARCFGLLTTAQRWSFAAARVTPLSLFRQPTAATISANVSNAESEPD